MALSEDEEFELLSLERERSLSSKPPESARSLSGFAQNAATDVKEIGTGLKDLAVGLGALPLHYVQSSGNFNEGPLGEDVKKAGRILKSTPQIAKGLLERGKEVVTDPVGSFYRRPVSTALDVASVVAPVAKATGATKILGKARLATAEGLGNVAEEAGMRSMFAKRFLKTTADKQSAKKAVRMGLDEGIISPTASAETMLERTAATSDMAGKRIGQFLKSQGEKWNWGQLLTDLDGLKRRFPADPEVINRIDNAKNIVRKTAIRYGGEIPFEQANQLKSYIQKKVPWNSDTAASEVAQSAAGTVRESIDTQLGDIASRTKERPGFNRFLGDKKKYGSSLRLEEALQDRASKAGNNMFGLPDWAAGGATFAGTGDPITAIATAIATKAVRSFGPQSVSFAVDKLAKALRADPQVFGKYGPILEQAAEKGTQAIALTNETLLKSDPEYANTIQKIIEGQDVIPFQPSKKILKPNVSDGKKAVQAEPTKVLDEKTARKFLSKANGDKTLARQIALEAGYEIV